MTNVRRYAEGTAVTVSSSRGEMTGILAKYGVERMAWATEPTGDTLQFVLEGMTFRLSMVKPTAAAMRERDSHAYSYPDNVDWERKAEAEWRRRWRANVMLLKAKLEFIDGGDTSIERELLPYLVLKDGRTAGESMIDSGLLLASGS